MVILGQVAWVTEIERHDPADDGETRESTVVKVTAVTPIKVETKTEDPKKAVCFHGVDSRVYYEIDDFRPGINLGYRVMPTQAAAEGVAKAMYVIYVGQPFTGIVEVR